MDKTGAERQKRYLRRLKAAAAAVPVLQAENAALKAQLKAAKAKPPQPPSYHEQRLEEKYRELAAEKVAMEKWYKREVKEAASVMFEKWKAKFNPPQRSDGYSMGRKTRNAISFALHTDRTPTAKERETALKLFNAWIDDEKKARQ